MDSTVKALWKRSKFSGFCIVFLLFLLLKNIRRMATKDANNIQSNMNLALYAKFQGIRFFG